MNQVLPFAQYILGVHREGLLHIFQQVRVCFSHSQHTIAKETKKLKTTKKIMRKCQLRNESKQE